MRKLTLCLSLLVVGCNLPIASPPQEQTAKTLGDITQRQEQAVVKFESTARDQELALAKLDNLRLSILDGLQVGVQKLAATLQAGRDAVTTQEQSILKLQTALQVQDVALAQLKVVTSQPVGRDANQPIGLINLIVEYTKEHGDGLATSGGLLAVVLGLWKRLRQARREQDTLVKGTESASEKISLWVDAVEKAVANGNGNGTHKIEVPKLDPKVVKKEIARVAEINQTTEGISRLASRMKTRAPRETT